MDRKPVELVHVPREEKYYEREDVLGRDAASVFPTESKKAFQESDAVKSLLAGNRKFISETELHEIKQAHGGVGRVEDGSIAADKPLAKILLEQKEAKEAAFQEQWRKMKTGKNRPLDNDELEFLDTLAESEAERQRRVEQEERDELARFQELQKQAESTRATAAEPKRQHPEPHESTKQQGVKKAKRAPLVTVVRSKPQVDNSSAKPIAAASKETTVKNDDAAKEEDSGGNGLGGLLGDYGSDSE